MVEDRRSLVRASQQQIIAEGNCPLSGVLTAFVIDTKILLLVCIDCRTFPPSNKRPLHYYKQDYTLLVIILRTQTAV